MAKTIVFTNHKGGVAKTTLCSSLADAFARDGFEVLLVDLDPQANLTGLTYSFDDVPPVPIERVLAEENSTIEAVIEKTRIPGVHLIGSTLKLANLEKHWHQTPFSSTTVLASKLAPLQDAYDIIIIDTPPSLNFLTANALAAADRIFVPIESGSKLSMMGTDDMLEFIAKAYKASPNLKFGGAVLTRHDVRRKMCKITAATAGGYYATVLKATMPPSTDIHKAQASGQTILQFDRDHTVSREVVKMAREIAEGLGIKPSAKEEIAEGGEHAEAE